MMMIMLTIRIVQAVLIVAALLVKSSFWFPPPIDHIATIFPRPLIFKVKKINQYLEDQTAGLLFNLIVWFSS